MKSRNRPVANGVGAAEGVERVFDDVVPGRPDKMDEQLSDEIAEPGRAVVARSGWLAARVLHVREREPALVVIDAGMTELIRPALYGAEHPMAALTSLGREVDPAD